MYRLEGWFVVIDLFKHLLHLLFDIMGNIWGAGKQLCRNMSKHNIYIYGHMIYSVCWRPFNKIDGLFLFFVSCSRRSFLSLINDVYHTINDLYEVYIPNIITF